MRPRYDGAARLSALTAPNGSYTYGYDATKGTLNTISDPDGGSLTYTYDGSLVTGVRWSGAVSGSIGFSYDNDFRVTSETVNGANAISFSYDADSLLTAAGAMTIARDPQTGFVTGTTLGGVTDSWTYNGFGEPLTYTASYNGTPYLSESYTRDDAGRIATKTETVLGSSSTYVYGYDTAGRLHTVTQDGTVTATYEYDSNSNRISKTTPTTTESGTYDAQDRMLTYNGATYTYSANGELQSKTDSSGTTTYVYDALGNLRNVTLPDGRVIEYVIDAQNRRVGKKVNGVLVQGFVYGDQLRIIAELDGAGNVVSRFIYGTRANVPDYMMKGGAAYRIVSDHLGSPKLVVKVSTGDVAEVIGYDEFGNVLADAAPGFQPFAFGGGLSGADRNVIRFGARDYDAATARWTAKDPIGFGGGAATLYAYSHNDPINRVDPDGLDTYLVNRTLGGEVPVGAVVSGSFQPISHTFIATTGTDGIHTYSWGNSPDGTTVGRWFKDAPEDMEAALEAYSADSPLLWRHVGDSSLDSFIEEAYRRHAGRLTDPSNHPNYGVWGNCKTEARKLVDEAKRLREEKRRKKHIMR